jgi:hypothetical protein
MQGYYSTTVLQNRVIVSLLQAEEEVEELRRLRAELETKEQEEDARSIFLHFTQEQLNSQVSKLRPRRRRTKEQEKDARSIFLQFTQEQLNSQVRRISVTHR